MFERFTQPARQAVVSAQEVARQLRHPCIGPEHLLYGLASQHGIASAALADQEITAQLLRQVLAGYHDGGDALDPDALATLGIDLEAVRRATEASFGPGALDPTPPSGKIPTGHLPFTRQAKKVLELSLREALRLGHKGINDGHVLLGLLRDSGGNGSGLAGKTLAERHVDLNRLRADIARRMTDEAA